MDLKDYRTNYNVEAWERIAAENGELCAPIGAVRAVNALCYEIERLEEHLAEAHCMQQCACAFDAPEHICDYHKGLIDAATQPLLMRIKKLEERGEPVAWIRGSGLEMLKSGDGMATVYRSEGMSNHSTPLYTAPSPEDK
jgi:hypothetical protein